eukprot:12069160-Karenia_brevis.AAC.1
MPPPPPKKRRLMSPPPPPRPACVVKLTPKNPPTAQLIKFWRERGESEERDCATTKAFQEGEV